MKKQPERKFNLITTTATIVGVVIGSGIFFKTPEILSHTNGNVLLGIFAFLLAGFGIIFGSLTMINYTRNDDSAGGLVSYCETSGGKNLGFLAGWFQTVLYFPAIIAIVTWVAANYTLAFFGQSNLLTTKEFNWIVWPLAILYLFFFILINLLQTRGSAKFQELSMFIKLGALAVLAIAGLILGAPTTLAITNSASPLKSSGFISALIAVAFTTDGWMIAPSIAHEIKDSKKNLSKALFWGPFIIIGMYLIYFYGVSSSIGPQAILAGVDPIAYIATKLFGQIGPSLLYLLVLISVFGALNGLTLTYLRLPYSMALRNNLPFSNYFTDIHKKYDTSINSGILCFSITLIYLILHFLSLDGNLVYHFTLFKGLEVDALPIVLNYVFLICIYLGVLFKPNHFPESSFIQKFVFPTLAILGALIIVIGGIIKPGFLGYMVISALLIGIGLLVRPKNHI